MEKNEVEKNEVEKNEEEKIIDKEEEDNNNNISVKYASLRDFIIFKEEFLRSLGDLKKEMSDNILKEQKKFDILAENNLIFTNNINNNFMTKINFIEEKNEIISQIKNIERNIYNQVMINQVNLSTHKKDLSNACSKYDKLIMENLLFPGLIGNACKFPTLKDYLLYNLEEMANHSSDNQKNSIEIKEIRNKLDNIYERLKIQIIQMKNTLQAYTDLKIKELNLKVDSVNLNNSDLVANLREQGKRILAGANHIEKIKNEAIESNTKAAIAIGKSNKNVANQLAQAKNEFKAMKKNIIDLSLILTRKENDKNKKAKEEVIKSFNDMMGELIKEAFIKEKKNDFNYKDFNNKNDFNDSYSINSKKHSEKKINPQAIKSPTKKPNDNFELRRLLTENTVNDNEIDNKHKKRHSLKVKIINSDYLEKRIKSKFSKDYTENININTIINTNNNFIGVNKKEIPNNNYTNANTNKNLVKRKSIEYFKKSFSIFGERKSVELSNNNNINNINNKSYYIEGKNDSKMNIKKDEDLRASNKTVYIKSKAQSLNEAHPIIEKKEKEKEKIEIEAEKNEGNIIKQEKEAEEQNIILVDEKEHSNNHEENDSNSNSSFDKESIAEKDKSNNQLISLKKTEYVNTITNDNDNGDNKKKESTNNLNKILDGEKSMNKIIDKKKKIDNKKKILLYQDKRLNNSNSINIKLIKDKDNIFQLKGSNIKNKNKSNTDKFLLSDINNEKRCQALYKNTFSLYDHLQSLRPNQNKNLKNGKDEDINLNINSLKIKEKLLFGNAQNKFKKNLYNEYNYRDFLGKINIIKDKEIIDKPLLCNQETFEVRKCAGDLEKKLLHLEFFIKKKLDELVREIKVYIPIHFNSHTRDYNIIEK